MGLIGARRDAGKEDKGKTGKKERVEPLTDRIKTFDYSISADTIKLIVYKKDKEKLRKAAEHGDTKEARTAAIDGLVKLGDESSILFLEEISRTDPEDEVRNAALRAIKKLSGDGVESGEAQAGKADERVSIDDLSLDDFDGALERISDVDDEWPDVELEDESPSIFDDGDYVEESEAIELLSEGDISQSNRVVKIVLGRGDIGLREHALDAIMKSGNEQAAQLIRICFGMKTDEELEQDELALKKRLEGEKAADAEYDGEVAELTQIALGNGDIAEKEKALKGLIESRHPDAFEMIDLYLTSQDEKELSEEEMKLKKDILEKLEKVPQLMSSYFYLFRHSRDVEIKGIILGKFKERELEEFEMNDLLSFIESDGNIGQREKILRYLADERSDAPVEAYKKMLHGKRLENKEESGMRSMIIDNLSYYYGTYEILAVLKEVNESDCNENNRKRAGQLIEFLEATR